MVIYDAETNAEELEKLSSDYAYPKNFNLEQLIKEIDEKIKKHPKLKNPAFINKKLTAYRSKKNTFYFNSCFSFNINCYDFYNYSFKETIELDNFSWINHLFFNYFNNFYIFFIFAKYCF